MMATVGFVGLGRMGGAMAGHLAAAGHHVLGVDISPEARAAAESDGVEVVESRTELAVPVVMSSLPGDAEAEEVYLGGLFERLEPGALCIDLSTIDVNLSRRIAGAAGEAGIRFLDCPVSGTSVHARAGTLAVMVGGDPEAVEEARPLLNTFASSVHHIGPNGAGLEMKLITNRLLNAHVVAIAEAILAMEDAGLDPTACLELLRQGAVPRLLDYKAEPMARRDHSPLFTVALMAKDLGLADARRSPGPVSAAGAEILRLAQDRGWGDSDISAVIEVLADGG
ncbi:MAG TPA: NAD(P)-dependent oxidoreductase [Acidimicrobiia bacterium]|nr:NAD(P)-dependent oxidoreductase [Acidimicrobiia bacterium]